MKSSNLNSQFKCAICGDGFEQKSRLERHMDTAHPPSAPSAADVEKVLGGIQYPKIKEQLIEYASHKGSTAGQDLLNLIKSLPDRTYRDSAEVAIALGELKSGKKIRSAKEVERTEQPGTIGGRAATVSPSVSAATIAKVLSGIDFPKSKGDLKEYALVKTSRSAIQNSDEVLKLLKKLPSRKYTNMADVEHEIGRLK